MNKRLKRKNFKLKQLQNICDEYKNRCENLQKELNYHGYLERENQKMIEWIQKILKEFGTREINDRHIEIPIMRMTNNYNGLYQENIIEETIIIPEIVIKKMVMK